MTCEEKRIQNNWTQKQYEECVQKNLPDLSEANEKAKEFKSEKGIIEKGIDKVKEAANIIDLGLKTIDKISESYSEADKLNNLKNIKISPETYADEDSDEYFNPEFLKSLGQNMSTNDPLKVSEEEDAIFSQLGMQLALDKNKDNPDYKPSTMDIWHESYRLKTLAAQDASGEDATILENLAGKNIVTNVISDVYRSVDKGYAQPENLETSLQIFNEGNETEDKILQKFLEDKKELIASNQDSDEARAFQKCVEKNGDGFLSLGLCAIQNPGYIVQAGVESMALNAGAVTQSQTVRNNAFGGVVSGVAAGSVVPGLGNVTGAMSGMFYGIGSTLEKGITFDELLIDATGIEDVSKITVEDLRKVLNDPEKLKDIQTKAERRGQVIGAVSALSGGAAAKTTTALVKAGKGAKVAAAAGGSVEMVGEGVGEYLGQKAAGQALSRQEIFLESFAGLGTKAPISVGGTLLNLNQLSTNFKVRNSVKANGFTSMSDAFKPDVKTDQTQIDVSQIPNAEKTLNFELENKIKRKIITPEEAKNIQTSFRETKAVVNQIKRLGLSKTQQSLTVDLLKEKKNLETTINQVNDESLTGKQSERVNEINEELKNVGEQETQKSVTKEAQGKKGQEIDNLAGQKNEDGKYEVTKAEWDSGKADEVITEIYSNDMLTGLIESKIPIEKPPGFSKPDFISATIAELIPHIRNFNPEINDSLNGWIIPQINNKVGNVFKKGEAATKKNFETSLQTGKVDGTSIDLADTDANTIEDNIDIENAKEDNAKTAADKLRAITGITIEETTEAGNKIIGEKIRVEPVKGAAQPAKRDVSQSGKLKFSTKVIDAMGGKLGTKENKIGNYVTFLENNSADIASLVNAESEIKNTVLREIYKPKKVGRTTGKFDKGAGKGVFEYQNENPTAQDFINWATDPTKGLTTLINRQATLADVLSGLLGRASTLETVATPEGKTTFEVKQELQGKKIKPDTIDRLISDIDIKIKNLDIIASNYKGVLASGITPGTVAKALKAGLKILKAGLKAGKPFAKVLEKAIAKIKSFFPDKLEADAIEEAVREEITIDTIADPDVDVQIERIVEKAKIKAGIAYERVIYDNAAKVKNPSFKTKGVQTEVGGAADFQGEIAGKDFDVEVKLENPQYSSVNGTYDFVKGVYNYSAKSISAVGTEFKTELDGLVKKAKIPLKKYYEKAKELGVDLKTSGTAMPLSIFNELKSLGLQNNITQRTVLSESVIEELYNSKGTFYMQIKGKGLHYIGSNPLNLPVPKLEGDVTVTLRIARSATDKNGNVRPILRILPDNIDITSDKSNFGIDTAAGIESLLNTPEVKKLIEIQETEIKANNTIKKGKEALAKNPNLQPTVTDPVILDRDINKMIKDTKGIAEQKRFSDVVAKRRGASVRNFRLISSGAQDFNGLMYDLYGKGKLGEKQQAWVKKNLVKPYQDGVANIDKYRQALKNDYATLLKTFPEVTKKLGKIASGTEFTFDQALRVNLWTEAGFEIPGLSQRDTKKLNDIVNKDPELKLFNQAALDISKQDKWVEPSAYWDTESLISDLNNLTNKVGRKQFLAEFITNSDVVFSKENLNKMEVALGTNWRDAMEDSLYRMRNGTNRPAGTNKLTNNFLNWVNNSVGAIMFFNIKSALLQTISSVNFLNWSDNNPYKAAMAFGNQPQFWSDFTTLWNSPKLKQRRSGLRKDVNEAELANAAKGATNKASAALSYLLKLGFTPTQMADSFAIASGGATFYRNRINTLKQQGLDQKAAEEQAFADFAEASDVAQQSADPMLISSQQASPLGRLILAFQNTPAQVTRIFNKSARDFINGRGDQKTNISKMIYYGAVQGFIFAALQNAAFALIPGFDDEEKDEEKKAKDFDKKEQRILNSMVDTMLRGSGVYGAIVATLKNTAATYYREEQKSAFGRDHTNTLTEIMNLSPPVGSKLRKINNAIKAKEYNSEVVKEQGWDVTLKGKVNLSPSYQVIASLTEAITNLPLERAVVELDRVVEMLDARNTTFQRVALALGYRTWDVGTKNEERDLVKIESKEAKEKARKQKVIDDRAERLRLKEIEKYKGKTEEEIKQIKRKDSIFDTNKSDQITSLKNLGLTTKQIKELKYEDDRVNKIIELTNK